MAAPRASSASLKSDEKHADPEKSAVEARYAASDDTRESEGPLAQFSADEVKRAWRKVDFHILPIAVILYLSSYIDRANIGNAKVLGLATSLKLTPNQYNLALSIFFVGYVVFETPSNIIIKRTSPRWYIPIMTVLWGMICCLTSLVKSSAGLSAARFFLGLAEAGFLPGIVFWMGSWYPRPMQGRRYAILYSSVSLTGAFGGLLATAIHALDGVHGIAGWQWIFIVEGVITIGLGLLAMLFLTASPETSSWLSDRERLIIQLTNEADRALKAQEGFSGAQIKSAFTDWRTWLWGLMYFTTYIPVYSVVLSLPTVVTGLGYSGTGATVMAVWPYFVGFAVVLIAGWTTDRWGLRFAHYAVPIGVVCVALVVLMAVRDDHVRYGMFFLVMFMFVPISTMWAWLASNVAGSNKRAAATGVIFSLGNIGGTISGQIYRAEWAPRYVQGHAINLACYAVALITGAVMWASYRADNAARDRAEGLEAGAGAHERRKGLLGEDLGNLGDRHPHYRYLL
ncbi:MFS general substrate transporter [Phanerochaete sordida]|uniref:MFS general substrate transporter n=1 Tax=Phanerochaete sordida TaxID=48140 RepID=A0A9P3GHN6_9APHY|nr:MFS general substrate transporter [Phanerochaete sordida]